MARHTFANGSVLLTALMVMAVSASAQTTGNVPAPLSSRVASVPWLSVGVAGGTDWGESGSALLLSVQVPLDRFVILESETTRRGPGRWPFETLTTGVNMLFKAGTPRLTGFAGAGVGVQRTSGCHVSVRGGQQPSRDSFCPYPETSAAYQATGGIEVPLGFHLAALGLARVGTAPEDGFRLFAGVRVPIGRRTFDPGVETGRDQSVAARAARAEGKEVRVRHASGKRLTGALVSLSESAVVLRSDGRDVTIPLSEVRKVEHVSHGVRIGALIGGLAALGGIWVPAMVQGCGECPAVLVTAVALGTGAGVGAIANAARRDGNLIYDGAVPATVSISPIFTSRRQGAALALHW